PHCLPQFAEFDEANHHPVFQHIVGFKVKQKANNIKVAELPSSIPNSPNLRPIRNVVFPASFYTRAKIQANDENPRDAEQCLIAMRELFYANSPSFMSRAISGNTPIQNIYNYLVTFNAKSTSKNNFLTTLINFIPEQEINSLLDGKETPIAQLVLFALVKIMRLPYTYISFYMNARYEAAHAPDLAILNDVNASGGPKFE
nr:hypothetical protein [Pseudomonadota bacterium]